MYVLNIRYFLISLIILFPFYSVASQILEPKTIVRTFSEGSSKAGFYTSEGLLQCKWGIMYIDLSTEAGKAMFSQVLTAKSAGFKVVRIDYTKSGELCTATGLHIQ
ncbi:conserved hypothetical protein [Vibrio nigripulchritudo MADA3029]|nr:conserved hypothetical protein [Vibrio nigripulchritudo MADA3020]CCN54068.1 conserved hypothetical protein [Vibrio nigripulchritudo MADA3021]CCN60929.1 conserved hypothetical protein [Vibrio nigripulchritudo MADA3029]